MTVERITPGSNAWKETHASHASRYSHALPHLSGLKVLDAACGVGYGSHMIAEAGASEVTGIDVSDEALEIAKREFAHPQITFQKADALAMPFDDNTFDAVTTFETIEHLKEPEKFLQELKRVLKPGGKLFLSCPNSLTNSLSTVRKVDNPWHFSEMTLDELDSMISTHFEITGHFHQSPTLEQITASHLEHINVCIDRSLAIKAENALRRILGKDPIKPRLTVPPLDVSIRTTGEPIRPIEDRDGPWPEHALVFLIEAVCKH